MRTVQSVVYAFLITLLLLHATGVRTLTAQQSTIRVAMQASVDTSQPNVREIYRLWSSYLNDRPDSAHASRYWSVAEQRRYPVFDITGGFIYYALRYWKPLVLSIEPAGTAYEIRTAYLESESVENDWSQKLWAIQRVFASRTDGAWKLESALSHTDRTLETTLVGRVRYHFSHAHAFSRERALQTSHFVDSLTQAFHTPQDTLEYYLADNQGELGDMVGLSYCLGLAPGFAESSNHQVFCGNGTEWYPHEMVHGILSSYTLTNVVNEGIATYLGGSSALTFAEVLADAKRDLKKLPGLTFDSIVTVQYTPFGTGIFYVTGALLCDEAYRIGGYNVLREFLRHCDTLENTYSAIERYLHLPRPEINAWWRRRLELE